MFKWVLAFFQIKFPYAYSIALNSTYLLHIINILDVVTNRLFPDPVSKGVRHSHQLAQGGSEWICLDCLWCLVTAHDTRMITILWSGLAGPNNTPQTSISLLKHSTLCERLIHSITFLKYYVDNHQVPESQTEVIKYPHGQAQAVIKLFWCSHPWLALSQPCELYILLHCLWARFPWLWVEISS